MIRPMRALKWLIAVVLLTGYSAPAQAQVGVLKVLGEDTRGSASREFEALPDGSVVFCADDGVHGKELWRTDGTTAGTTLVADLAPGPTHGQPADMTRIGDWVYFITLTPQGMKYWRTDGTAAGTVSFHSGPPNAWPQFPGAQFKPYGDEVVFDTFGTDGRAQIWATDGTAAGSRQLASFFEGAGSTLTWEAAGGEFFFTSSQRVVRADNVNVEPVAVSYSLAELDGYLISASLFGVYVVPPGETKAILLESAREHPGPEVVGGRLYYIGMHGLASWTPSEGVRDVSSTPLAWTEFMLDDSWVVGRSGNRLFWAGLQQGDSRVRLWTSDGITSKSVGSYVLDPHGFVDLGGGRVLFAGRSNDTQAQPELWVSDGTANGTRPISRPGFGTLDIAIGRGGFVTAGDTADFGYEPFRVDEATGAALLLDVNRQTVGSEPEQAVPVGDRVIFRTNEHEALWATDGTPEGTTALTRRGLEPSGMDSDGTIAHFAAPDGIYRSDGTVAGTTRIANPGLDPFSFRGLGQLGSAYLFTAHPEDADTSDLWRTDDTAAGTQQVTTGLPLGYASIVAWNATTMLLGNGPGLWRTDGTAAGTGKLFPSAPPTEYGGDAWPLDDGFLAGVDNIQDGHELWRVDRAGGNPRLLRRFAPGGFHGGYPRGFGQVGTRVLFAADSQWHTLDLATGQIEPLTALQGWTAALDPPATVNGVTYVSTYDAGDTVLYRTDGTASGTQVLHRFKAYNQAETPYGFVSFGGVTYFAADDDDHGLELWRTDGTPEGTRLERDIVPGYRDSAPREFVEMDDYVFFIADSLELGTEPWRIGAPQRLTQGEPVPEVIELPAPVTPAAPASTPARRVSTPATKPSVSVRTKRLSTRGNRARWRVTGTVKGTSCAGRVRISLGRGNRTLTRVSAPLRRCAFNVVVTAGRRSTVRWVQVRTVPSPLMGAATSKKVSLRR